MEKTLYDISVKDTKGNDVSLSNYEGKVLLIVNTATGCGLTPQYEALENLYRRYKDQGFEILDFPCNQFMEQAKGTDAEIGAFCTARYDTTFPRFKKIEVNGENESSLYTYLKSAASKRESKGNCGMSMLIALSSRLNGKSKKQSDIKWNFEKFLVDRQGKVVKRFAPTVKPEQIEEEIAKLIKAA